ncbi:MAG: hybrid sensor histidine kinase/response regulator [Flavobacteriaceae bacterium]|nr:MAG: hybrid sensor histidine kinase/response regulator [Flavobacteriaceae bacterium]
MKYYLLFLFLLSSFFPNPILGQEISHASNHLKFKHLSTKDGLSQGSVLAILQDTKGYLWFGTRDGLNKYDGSKFISYRHNSEDRFSISHSWITSIYQDSEGTLWVGTKNGLNKYNAQKDNFTHYKHQKNASSISDSEIWDITQPNTTHIWVATNKGIDRIHLKNGTITPISNAESVLFKGKKIRSLLKIPSGNVWITSTDAIYCYNITQQTFKEYQYPTRSNNDAHINNPLTLFLSSKDELWLGYGKGLAKLNRQKNIFENFTLNNQSPITVSVRSICEDFKGDLWIGTYQGLHILNPSRAYIRTVLHDENNRKSLSQNSIYKIIQDSRGDMWIGTWAGGINFFDRSYDNFKQLSTGSYKNMLNYKVISAIVEGDNNTFWLGTEGGGINVYDRKEGTFNYFLHDKNKPNSLSSNNVKSMIKDHRGNYWIGTHDGGINYLNPHNKPYSFKHLNQQLDSSTQVSDCRILTLLEDVDHNLWMGTLTSGLLHYNTNTKLFKKVQNKFKSITSIVQSSDPSILLIGGTKGVEKINIHDFTISAVTLTATNKNEDNSTSVNCIYEDKNNYWVGTEGKGLYYFNSKTQELRKYGIAQGLPNEVIYAIVPDNNNHIWISTNNGISRLNLFTKKINNFDESDGLQSNEFNYGASLKTIAGELMFGGTNGLNYFNPANIIENTFIPSVDIFSLKVSNKPFLKITDSVKSITLNYDQNDFSFDFTALSYSQSNKNSFAYKLEGFDPQWNYIGDKKTATYTNLDEGTYNFKVKASNNNGLWNEKGAEITLKITPAPWKTWWAYFIYLLGILTVLYIARFLMLTRIKERNELKQEKRDKEKLEEVNKLKLRLFTNISHDFRTPLTLITGPVEQLLKIKHSDPSANRNLETIQRNTNILLQLINELLDFRKSESGKIELYASHNNIIPFTENIKLSFEQLALQRNINYTFTHSLPELNVWFDKVKFKKILFNVLSNAFKFTPDNSEISIHISQLKPTKNAAHGFVKIDITNYGELIKEAHLKFVFDRFFQVDQQHTQTGTGIGLSLTKGLVALHKGTITVQSSEKKGTCFSIICPLGKEHLSSDQCVNTIEKSTTNDVFDTPVYVQKQLRSHEIIANQKTPVFLKEFSTLLIVEDNIEVRHFIKNIFCTKYNIFEANNGSEAINIAKTAPIDLIISDIMMPIMDGFEMCRTIKTTITTSHIPIILLTAKTSLIHKGQGYKLGANAYITKPFDAHILEVRVDNLLKSRENLISKFKKDLILKPKELTITSSDEKFLEKAIQIVEKNIADSEFNVYMFTDQMNMSRSVLFRKIKALTGQSISSFIRTIKIKRAGQLLVKTSMNISEIAYEVGFNDLKYFRKCFKNEFNEVPSDYRNSYNKVKDQP